MTQENAGLQSSDRLLFPAVHASLAALSLPPTDLAAAKLAEKYAREIDAAAGAAAHADRVLSGMDPEHEVYEAVKQLRARLSYRSALENLGPKLEAVLGDLGATPKARAAAGKGGGQRGKSKLDSFRQHAG